MQCLIMSGPQQPLDGSVREILTFLCIQKVLVCTLAIAAFNGLNKQQFVQQNVHKKARMKAMAMAPTIHGILMESTYSSFRHSRATNMSDFIWSTSHTVVVAVAIAAAITGNNMNRLTSLHEYQQRTLS